ncbi:MAG: pyridoxal phosphate-dependent aminotransferase [Treponema sp.]|nr:pyridoxal phosphate-dependent aminotransferase [Treponema sp.]
MKYNFNKITDRSNTFAIKYDLKEIRNKPKDVLSLWVADMDFPTAPCILKALKKASCHGIFGYSRPDVRYYNAIKSWYQNYHNFILQDEWIINTPGVVFGIAAAIKAFTKERDGVLIQRPVYYPFFNTIKALNRKVVNNALVLKDGHYEIDFEDFEEKIKTQNVKLFVLCSPHNPGGRVWKKEELNKISKICLKHNVLVVSDEIHSDITFGTNEHTIYASLSEKALNNSIICTSPSKTFNLAGLQFSNIIIANKEIRTKFKAEITKTGYDEPNLTGIVAATSAYKEGRTWFTQAKDYIQKNIDFTKEYFKENLPQVRVMNNEGTYLIWLDFSDFGFSDKKIDEIIVNKAKVWLDRGTMFGPEGEYFQRINVATPRKILKEALDRITKAFKEELKNV